MVLLRGVGIFLILLVCAFVISACSALEWGSKDGWKQGPAIKFPHVVSTIDSLALQLVEDDRGQLGYALVCRGRTAASKAIVTVEVRGGKEKISRSYSQPECKSDDIAGTGSLGQLEGLRVGQGVDISLAVELPQKDLGMLVEETVITYEMGADGKLRRGLGSVWREE